VDIAVENEVANQGRVVFEFFVEANGFAYGKQSQVLMRCSEEERCKLRNLSLGFIYQFHHLLPEFSALENVAMPLLIRRISSTEAYKSAAEVLKQVGLGHRLTHTPGELSGGERQRAAVARALVTRPACVLADEPTGNLDHKTGEMIFDLLTHLQRLHGLTSLLVTHNNSFAQRCDRILKLEGGVLVPG